jgi:hypothetical protein
MQTLLSTETHHARNDDILYTSVQDRHATWTSKKEEEEIQIFAKLCTVVFQLSMADLWSEKISWSEEKLHAWRKWSALGVWQLDLAMKPNLVRVSRISVYKKLAKNALNSVRSIIPYFQGNWITFKVKENETEDEGMVPLVRKRLLER